MALGSWGDVLPQAVLGKGLQEAGHQVLVMELPLFPFQNSYGKAQRDVVSAHDAYLLPKRSFAKVLGTKDGTLDDLHLSQTGHDAMAKVMAGVIQCESE